MDLLALHTALDQPAGRYVISDHGSLALLEITKDHPNHVAIALTPLAAVVDVRDLVPAPPPVQASIRCPYAGCDAVIPPAELKEHHASHLVELAPATTRNPLSGPVPPLLALVGADALPAGEG